MQRNSYFESTNVPQKTEPVGNMTKKNNYLPKTIES